jgi:hypothetical protein
MVAETGEKGNLTLAVDLLEHPTINADPQHDIRDQQGACEKGKLQWDDPVRNLLCRLYMEVHT